MIIERLEGIFILEREGDGFARVYYEPDINDAVSKINEIIDYINETGDIDDTKE